MKQLLNKLYTKLTEPLYRRLSRDIVLHMQELKRVQLEYQEKFTARICDQLVAIAATSTASTAAGQSRVGKYSDDEIIHYVVDIINTSDDLVALSKTHNIPLGDLVDIYNRYGGMNAMAIRKVRELERTNSVLAEAVIASEPARAAERTTGQTLDVSPRQDATTGLKR